MLKDFKALKENGMSDQRRYVVLERGYLSGLFMESSKRLENLLLTLGVLSVVLFPFTALPGIVIARKYKGALSTRGKVGCVLCWACMVVFLVHLLLVAVLVVMGYFAKR